MTMLFEKHGFSVSQNQLSDACCNAHLLWFCTKSRQRRFVTPVWRANISALLCNFEVWTKTCITGNTAQRSGYAVSLHECLFVRRSLRVWNVKHWPKLDYEFTQVLAIIRPSLRWWLSDENDLQDDKIAFPFFCTILRFSYSKIFSQIHFTWHLGNQNREDELWMGLECAKAQRQCRSLMGSVQKWLPIHIIIAWKVETWRWSMILKQGTINRCLDCPL